MTVNYTDNKSIQKAIKKLEANEILELPKEVNHFNYLQGLNREQKIAATQVNGNFLVIAGPGAGKTHTLVYRVVHLIKSGVPAKEICIVTFTRKAANELKVRINNILPDANIGFVGTIHALAYMLIRRGTSNVPRLIDPEDDLMVLKLVLEEGNYNIPKGIQNRTIIKLFDYMRLTMKTMKQTLVDQNRETLNAEDLIDIYNSYTTYKEENGYINYSDCIALATGLDRGFLKHLIVDEFQDTDPLQLSMLKSLKFPSVMGIGDDFQSIYSFRGADNTIILKFGEHFSNAKVIKLKTNYRSTQEIVDLENFVTNKSKCGYKKELISYRGSSNVPVIYCDTKIKQENFIMERVQDYSQQPGNKSIAVIYRYNRRKSIIETELIKNNIDYVVYGGLRLLERKHIKDIFAILLANRNKNDFIPYMRSLILLDGIGEVTAKKLINNNMSSSREDVQKLREILFGEYTKIETLIEDAEIFYLTLDTILEKSNYIVEEIKEDFKMLKKMAKEYSETANFISDIVIDSSHDQWSNRQKKANVVLTTIHSSKGLEFDEVHFLYDPDIEYTVSKQEENRRLFYTAISRAKMNLYIYDAWGRQEINKIIKDFEDGVSSNIEYYMEKKENIEDKTKHTTININLDKPKENDDKRTKFTSPFNGKGMLETILDRVKEIFKL